MEANWVSETIAYKGINKSYGTFFQNHIYSYHDAIVSIFYEKKQTIIKWYTLFLKQSSGMNNIFGYYHKRVIDRILVHVYGFFFIQV